MIPKNYTSILGLRETEMAIQLVKNYFERALARELSLEKISAPIYVQANTGINDDLNGVEKPVRFTVNGNGDKLEIVQSLAKWKRIALARFGYEPGEGIYTDMKAIRPDETISRIHSHYVDQWDWEKVITQEDRTIAFLEDTVNKIYSAMKNTEKYIYQIYPQIEPILPENITFIHTEELEKIYPNLTPREREDEITKEHRAVFLQGIGGKLKNGEPHDGRAPDYDDWTTPTKRGRGLNGDIIVWYPVLNQSLELSSMGIRVDPESLLRQLELTGNQERKKLEYHKKLLAGELPLSIGGGIGQSRLCMLYLRKAHIGEVQSSVWPKDVEDEFKRREIPLL